MAAHGDPGYTAGMSRLAALFVTLALLAGLAPAGAGGQTMRPDVPPAGSSRGEPAHRGHHRPGRLAAHRLPVVPCCWDLSYYMPPEPPTPAPPPILYVIPSPPTLVYIPPPRPEPAPEILLPGGRLERHGNGVEYPYTWVWVGAAPSR